MKHAFILIVLLSLWCFDASSALGQDYSVGGVVHDATGALIPGASVEVRGTGAEIVAASQTGEQGAFRIALPSGGTYQQCSRALCRKTPRSRGL